MLNSAYLTRSHTFLKREFKNVEHVYRMATNNWRTLPNFVIVGAQKGGTTFLYDVLCEHPQILPAVEKELHFFDNNYHFGLAWYRSKFPYKDALHRRARNYGGQIITGEATPYYMFHPYAPNRIAQDLPNVKLLIVLRNPVERAYSHYQMVKRKNHESLDFNEALEREIDRLEADLKVLEHDEFARAKNHQHLSYVQRGIYVNQIKNFESFSTRGQLLILSSQDLFDDPQNAFDEVTDYLGLDRWRLQDFSPRNQGSYLEVLKPETLKRLKEFYQPYNNLLYEYLGRDFGW